MQSLQENDENCFYIGQMFGCTAYFNEFMGIVIFCFSFFFGNLSDFLFARFTKISDLQLKQIVSHSNLKMKGKKWRSVEGGDSTQCLFSVFQKYIVYDINDATWVWWKWGECLSVFSNLIWNISLRRSSKIVIKDMKCDITKIYLKNQHVGISKKWWNLFID